MFLDGGILKIGNQDWVIELKGVLFDLWEMCTVNKFLDFCR